MNSILITGCNRGLGLGLVKALVELPNPPRHVIATCRNLEKASELKAVAAEHSNVHVLEAEISSIDCHEDLVKKVEEITKDCGLNVLFNNAGTGSRSTRITGIKEKDLVDTFHTNTVVPVMLAKAFLPLLKKASEINCEAKMGVERAAILNMSSILGSIQGNQDGGRYAYRASKSALNSVTKSLSIDLLPNKILCVAIHPGWVRTDMGGSNATLDVETSSEKMIETILNFNEEHNGGFYQFNGKQLTW